MRAMLIKLAGVRPVSCFTARITVSLRSALSWASLSSDGDAGRSIAALKQQGAGVMWRLRRGGAQRQRVQELRQPGGQLFKAPAVHQGDNLLETGKERAVAQQRLRRGDTGAGEYPLRAAPCRVQ